MRTFNLCLFLFICGIGLLLLAGCASYPASDDPCPWQDAPDCDSRSY